MVNVEIAQVNPSRFADGRWNHESERQEGEGDIAASYSGDVIAESGRIRAPFSFRDQLWICVGRSSDEARCYLLVPLASFEGKPTTYKAKTATPESCEEARNDPNGFYHGMSVTWRRKTFVLSGPEVRFCSTDSETEPVEATAQGNLFA